MPLYFINICNIILFQLEQSIHDQCLQFNDELMETGDFLREISSDRGKFSCLETFGHCKELIKWIKKETKGKK